MEKVKAFQITELTVDGFKCFDETTTFRFGRLNQIAGQNGKGKSSIADAIAFAITGVPFWGEARLDRLYHEGGNVSKELAVDLAFADENGTGHRLVRRRVNDNVTITLDGVEIRQTNLTTMFGERDIFLSMFNPLYFIERLGDKGRDLLMRHLPAISHEAVMEKMSEQDCALLEGLDMSYPEGCLKRLREDIRQAKGSITYTEGQRDLLLHQSAHRAERAKELWESLSVIAESISALEEQQFAGIDVAAKRTLLDDTYTAIDSLTGQFSISEEQPGTGAEIAAATEELARARTKVYRSKYEPARAEVYAAINTLTRQHGETKAALTHLRPGVQCMTCSQPITAENIEAVRAGLEAQLKQIVALGQAERAKLTELDELEQKDKAVFEQFKQEDIANLEAKIAELKAAHTAAVEELRRTAQTLEYDLCHGNLTEEDINDLTILRTERDKLTLELSELEEADDQLAKCSESMLISLRDGIKETELRMQAAALYISKRLELLFADFAMNHAAISLFRIVKGSGELKDAFDFTYEGRPYHWLSLSEKIKAGLEVAALIGRLTRCSYPVFVDNAESVTRIDNVQPSGQVFFARVQSGELAVKVLDAPTQSKETQAA